MHTSGKPLKLTALLIVAYSICLHSEPSSDEGKEDEPLQPTFRLISQVCISVSVVEPLGTIEPSGPFERAMARLLMAAYKRRLR